MIGGGEGGEGGGERRLIDLRGFAAGKKTSQSAVCCPSLDVRGLGRGRDELRYLLHRREPQRPSEIHGHPGTIEEPQKTGKWDNKNR